MFSETLKAFKFGYPGLAWSPRLRGPSSWHLTGDHSLQRVERQAARHLQGSPKVKEYGATDHMAVASPGEAHFTNTDGVKTEVGKSVTCGLD